MSAINFFAQGAYGSGGEDAVTSEVFECLNVGAVVNIGRGDGVFPAMPSYNMNFLARNLS